jgi:Rieske 2Fe-2S family protein
VRGAPTRTAQDAKTLARRYYAGSDIYDAETQKVFFKRWLYAGRETSLNGPGSYFLREIETESVIVLRDGVGELRAHHNVCRHRGTRLIAEPEGQLSKSIQCPYHAWTYGLDGALIGAPLMDEVESFRQEDYPLKSVAVATWEGCVFINLAMDVEPFEEAYAPLIDKFGSWTIDELEIAHSVTYEVPANWKLVCQNYSECYHCPNLHPVLNRLTPFRNALNDLEEGPFLGGGMRMAIDGGSMTMSGQRCASPLGDLSGEELNCVQYYTIYPNMLLSLHPDYVLIHRLERLATNQTRVICDWLFHPDAMSEPGFDPSGAIEFWNMTNKQDWDVSARSQQGISSLAYTPGPYSELESMIAAWDREYLGSIVDC